MHEILEEFCDKWVWPTMPSQLWDSPFSDEVIMK